MANAGLLIRAFIMYLQLPKVASEGEILACRTVLKSVCQVSSRDRVAAVSLHMWCSMVLARI